MGHGGMQNYQLWVKMFMEIEILKKALSIISKSGR